jgi:hypothetical protein
LILTVLVAQRRIEFVTTKGDRINRRSLDLKIIWDDIEGVARPSSVSYGDKRLAEWAKILTGGTEPLSLDSPVDRPLLKAALENWLTDWQSARVLERFNDLPDEILNTKNLARGDARRENLRRGRRHCQSDFRLFAFFGRRFAPHRRFIFRFGK